MMAYYWQRNTENFIVGPNGHIIQYGNLLQVRRHVPLRDPWFISDFDCLVTYDFCLVISRMLSDNREEPEELIEEPSDKD